ncbi:hypothetical protein DWU98_02465 [Dyella monticola]|uniref:Uncharacterized protein n=1 Tax=Dyella monticola TaxID=1927958 RepID=A0A370X8X1_9GAMM|nr:hypothetical protein DWU98_02465 [Dyella monticola]
MERADWDLFQTAVICTNQEMDRASIGSFRMTREGTSRLILRLTSLHGPHAGWHRASSKGSANGAAQMLLLIRAALRARGAPHFCRREIRRDMDRHQIRAI